jgi:ABC-type transport system involved in Fe-S cluster assembly fused permease/ATPase subunit
MQKNHIFDGTIEDNIKYGNPQATHDDVVNAARRAFLYDQVMQLPKGFESSALRLSGGQQQRVAIARMFIKNPTVIILNTVKGKGVSFMENNVGFHGKACNPEEYAKPVAELKAVIR